MNRFQILVCLLSVGLGFGCGPKPEEGTSTAEIELVREDAQRTVSALYGNDVETVLKLTHPKIIEMMGGPSQAKATVQGTLKQIIASEIKIESLTFPKAPIFLKAESHEFVMVPMKLVMAIKGDRFESLNYELGVREIGQTHWGYVDGSGLTRENIRSFFPDFPHKVELPKVSRKKI